MAEQDRAPYGRRMEGENEERGERRKRKDESFPKQHYAGETYYGRPAIKASHYRWTVIGYLFVGGIAGAAQIIATIADLFGGEHSRPVVRAGRYIALVGALISPVLLIVDLGTPQRFYNMLRIFRKSSMMSIGSWTLSIFGLFTGLVAAAQLLDDVLHVRFGRTLARLLGIPAAVSSVLMATYTGTLLSATSVPLWAAANRTLAALFGASATATAVAALTLVLELMHAPADLIRRLERLGLCASAAELALMLDTERRIRKAGVAEPLLTSPIAPFYRFGVLGLGIGVPLVAHIVTLLSRRPRRSISIASSISALVGGFILRGVIIFAGNASARRPQDYFHVSQPAKE